MPNPGTATRTASYVAHLDCLHENRFSAGEPKPGEIVWCVKCYGYRVVRHVGGNYGVSCSDCTYARNYGGQLTARTKGASHALRKVGHRVTIYGPEFCEVVEYGVTPLPFDGDEPPF